MSQDATPSLSPEQVAQYWEDGFLIGVPILDADETRELREEFFRIEAEQRAAHGGTWEIRHHYPWQATEHPMKALYHRVALHPRLVAAAASILGPTVLIRNCDVFVKEPGVKRTVAWHLDTAMHDGTEDAYVTAWVGLGEDGANATNGGLQFLRGGHRIDIPDRPTDRHRLSFTSTAMTVVKPERVVQTDMPQGHASFHHACMPHFSGPDLSPHRRIGFVVRFMGAGISGNMAESGSATLAAGTYTRTEFALKTDFPVTWTPQIP